MKQLFKIQYILILFIVLANNACQENFEYKPVGDDSGKYAGTAWDYLSKVPASDSLTLMKEAVTLTTLENIYSGTDKRTFVVPRNKAFRAYLKSKGVKSLSQLPVNDLREVLMYHIAKGIYNTQDPKFMAKDTPIKFDTETTNPIFFSHNTNFQTQINFGTKKVYTVYTSNIQPTNGVIQITSDVIAYIP